MAEKKTEHKDLIGQTIVAGAIVTYSSHNQLALGSVLEITPKMVKLMPLGKKRATSKLKYPTECIVVTDNPYLTMHFLSENI